jgi:transcriptional regulator CtsR
MLLKIRNVSEKRFRQMFQTNVSEKVSIKCFRQMFQKKFQTSVSEKRFRQMFQKNVSEKSFRKTFQTNVSEKHFRQTFQKKFQTNVLTANQNKFMLVIFFPEFWDIHEAGKIW